MTQQSQNPSRALPSLTLARLVTLLCLLVGLTACSGAQEYRGEANDCSSSVDDADVILLLDRDEMGKVTGGWFAFEVAAGTLIGAEIENIDADEKSLVFDVEFDADNFRMDVEVELDREETDYVGEIQFEGQDQVRCDIELELESAS